MRGQFRLFMASVVSLLMWVSATDASEDTIRVAVVQTVVADSLEVNRDRIIRFIKEADAAGCQLVVFSENELHWDGAGYVDPADVPTNRPTKSAMDAAIEEIRRVIRDAGIVVIFGADSRRTEGGRFSGRAYAFGPDGEPLAAYWKDKEVPPPFDVGGVRCNFMICSDRGYLEHSDLPCLVEGTRVIIDTSGGHGGDDGRPVLRRIRYRPWAQRTGAYVIVSNPVHEDTDFMGHSPWGGGSAVIRPDGSIAAGLTYEKDAMIVVDVDVDQTAPQAAQRRREHPLFREFWDTGERLLKGEQIGAVPDLEPYESVERDIKIAAAQLFATSDMAANTRRILAAITEAAGETADVVVFPELAVTGSDDDSVLTAEPSALEGALRQIQEAARANRIYVIVGMPHVVNGTRSNCAFVIGDDGSVRTRYDQLATSSNDLFQPGTSTKAMWFTLKGVHSIVTIGDDADWVEIGDLAAARGMCLRFHISAGVNDSPDEALIRKQRDLLALSSAQFGAAVNARSGSLIASREGGHNKPAPAGMEHYLPYQTSIVCSAESEETILYASRRTRPFNSQDLNHYWRNRQRKSRAQTGWFDWIKAGAWLIDADDPGEVVAVEEDSARTQDASGEAAASSPTDMPAFKGRIAYSADGNFNDPDDWASSAIALAVLSHAGVEDRLVHFDYNCILPRNDPQWEQTHTDSVVGAAERYGYERSIFHDCRKDLDGALASIAEAINASSADDPLYFILAGPMEVPFLGIEKSDPDKRQFVYCISHSRWNDGFSSKARHDSFIYNKRSVIGTGINWVQVPGQNLLATSPYGREARPAEWAGAGAAG